MCIEGEKWLEYVFIKDTHTHTPWGREEYIARHIGGIERGRRPSAIRTPMRENCYAILHDPDAPNKMIGAQGYWP